MNTILHPRFGKCKRVKNLFAVRWKSGVNEDARSKQLAEVGVRLEEKDVRAPHAAVNQSTGLSWVNAPAAAAKKLAASELVQWVAPGLETAVAGKDSPRSLIAVNPTRIYLRAGAGADAAAAVAELDAQPDQAKTNRLPGLLAYRTNNALQLVERLAETSAAGIESVVVESIPYHSPLCAPRIDPNDPLMVSSWGLERVHAPYAWAVALGDPSITVAVIDQGVELAHPDLDMHPMGWNASDDTPNGAPVGNHGTPCAGIVAQRINNDAGGAGVAPGCRIMPIATSTWADVDIAESLVFAADNGARVVSMSFGVYDWWNVWDFSIIRAAMQYAADRGLILIAASGNENLSQSRFPGSDSRTICVGGSNVNERRKSNGDGSGEPWWGACYGPDLDVVAPCHNIPATDRLGAAGYSLGDYTTTFNGTSSATPHVAGLAALLLSANPSLTAAAVRRIIESTCDKISSHQYAYAQVPGKPSGSWHEEVGYGRINCERALNEAMNAAAQDEDCCGCASEVTIDPACRSPHGPPWLDADTCIISYERQVMEQDERLAFRVTYEHCLRLIGRQQGPLLYTVTLLPQETVRIVQYERHREMRSQQASLTVQAVVMQYASSLTQQLDSASSSTLDDRFIGRNGSSAVGGGLLGIFGGSTSSGSVTNMRSSAAVRRSQQRFSQALRIASTTVAAQRSVTVSTAQASEEGQFQTRTLVNNNDCHAMSYFIRQAYERWEHTTTVHAVEWRLAGSDWRDIDDVDGVPGGLLKLIDVYRQQLPKPGETASSEPISLPTDGTVVHTELAVCGACEPNREAQKRAEAKKAQAEARITCLEAELMALELERRKALLADGRLDPFETTGSAEVEPSAEDEP